MENKNIKDSIKVSDKLDEYILNGIEQGRIEKKLVYKTNNTKRIAKVASVLVIGTIAIGFTNPNIVRAIPIIGKVLEGFDSSNFGMPTDKYIKYSKGVDIISENKEAKINLNEIIIDENICMLGFIIESDSLKGFKGKNEYDFINVDANIKLNGKDVNGIGHKARIIDDRTGAYIITANITELELKDNIDVDIKIDNINGTKSVKGNWEFKVKTEKVKNSKRINVSQTYDINGRELVIDEIVVSPIASTVMISGIDNIDDSKLMNTKYKVLDDKGNILISNKVSSEMDTKTGKFNTKLQIDNDLSNSEYIEIIPYWGSETIYKEIEGTCIDLLTTTGSGEREEILISRPPTKGELKSGYALSKVYYNLNLDKNKEFLSIEELKNYEIEVNNNSKVIIKDIEIKNDKTKVIMQVIGDYKYQSGLVLFDEEMNDTARWEGHMGAVIEDEKEGIYSIYLDKIDISKKYKIALPMTKDVDLNSKYKMKIEINKYKLEK